MNNSLAVVQTDEYEYDHVRFDYSMALTGIRFMESVLFVPEGAHSRRPLILRPWQKKLVLDVYRVDRITGLRPVRHATLSIGRKNGKTAIISALMLCHLCGPFAVQGGELSSFALTREQAAMLFRYAAGMVRLSHRLTDRLQVTPSKKYIFDPVSGSHYTALSADAKSQLGRSPIVAFGDELGAFRQNRDLYDSLMTGQGAHSNPLMWVLSTQAPSDQALLSELLDYSIENPEDESYYVCCFNLDEEDDPWLEENWYKANPALGDFLSLDDFRIMADKAKKMPGARPAFFNLRLNQRIDSEASFVSREAWLHQVREGVPSFEDLRDMDVSLGIDLAMRRDLAALVFLGHDAETNEIIVVPAFFMPKKALNERQEEDKVDYKGWAAGGLLITPPGNSIDFEWVAKWMVKTVEDYNMNVTTGGYDRYKMAHLQKAWENVGAETMFDAVEPFGQGYVSMSPALDILESYVYEGKLWHGCTPILTWNMANCVVTSDPAGNRKLDKSKSYSKIDGAVALAMALKTMDLEEAGSYLDSEDATLFLI